MSDDPFKPFDVSEWNRNPITFHIEDPANPSPSHPPPPTRRQRIHIRWFRIKHRIIDIVDVARHGPPD